MAAAVSARSSSPIATPECWKAYGSESAPAPSVDEHMLNAVPHSEPWRKTSFHRLHGLAPGRSSGSIIGVRSGDASGVGRIGSEPVRRTNAPLRLPFTSGSRSGR